MIKNKNDKSILEWIQISNDDSQAPKFEWNLQHRGIDYSGKGIPGDMLNRKPDVIEWDDCPEDTEWELIEMLIWDKYYLKT